MRIALFDGIVETHVASSLERALVAAGHSVLNTGKVGHGYKFATGPGQLHVLNTTLDKVIDFRPDVIFVFRPASLPMPLLERAKRTGARLVAWLSDDPVLWDLSYGPVVESYDVVLHCGTARVLEFYESMFGRPTGVNFPFWTDQTAFPYVFGSQPRESDAIFLGNVHDEVRRTRYFDLGSLTSSIRIHGNVGRDYYHIGGGFLDSDQEVVEAGARTGLAINIPQYFRDHQGLETWFEGLDKLGFFQYPSRVIQYAAMGIPIVSVVPDAHDLASFPEIVCVDSITQVDATVQSLLASGSLESLSRSTHDRFLRNYSAASRVMALESVLSDDSWTTLNATERSLWFTQFDALQAGREDHEPVRPGDKIIPRERVEVSPTVKARSIAVLGVGFRRVTSTSSVAMRALRTLGHTVEALDLAQYKNVLVPDPNGEFKFVINASKFVQSVDELPNLLIISGLDCGITQAGRDHLADRGVRVAVIGAEYANGGEKVKRLASRVDYLGLLNETVADGLVGDGFETVEHLPHLADRSFRIATDRVRERRQRVVVAGKRRLHFSKQAAAFRDVADWPSLELFFEESPEEFGDLQSLAEALKSTVVLAPFDASVPGPLPSEALPFALASGALVVVPRGVGTMNICPAGVASISVRERGELAMKLARLSSSKANTSRILAAAREMVSGPLNAERRFESLVDRVFPEKASQVTQDQSSVSLVGSAEDGGGCVLGHHRRSITITHDQIPGKGTDLVVTINHGVSLESAGMYKLVVNVGGSAAYMEVLRQSPVTRNVRIHVPRSQSAPEVTIAIVAASKSLKIRPMAFPTAEIMDLGWADSLENVNALVAVSNSAWGSGYGSTAQ
ncbi:glycosyltransferase [Arthrobacter sp. fls2-241-R2A-200]|uniref:glycosyltransferase n=1 Tax=Arthrobacter sp. fls2-241-R2A-200 TaxID=3040281 RepID=UPI002549DD8B|nr:glycosyltransferase [Arthrobacter sp. fls2-241-R2A-200]